MFQQCFSFIALFLVVTLSSQVAFAQADESGDANEAAVDESPPAAPVDGASPDKIRFAAIVQFAVPGADRIDARKARVPLSHKDTLYEGDRLRVAKGAHVKLVLKSGCVAVIYGDAAAIAPDREKPWRVRADAFRWICESNAEPVSVRGGRIDPSSSEIFVSGNRMLVLRGSPRGPGLEDVAPKTVFAWEKNSWVALKSQPSLQEIYRFNQSLPAPKESIALERPPQADVAKKPAKTRVLIGPIFGPASFQHDQSAYSDKEMHSSGARIQVHRRREHSALIFAITPHFEMSNEEERSGCMNCPSADPTSAEIEGAMLEGGIRFHPDRWYSAYARGGLAWMKSELNIRTPENFYYDRETDFYGVSLAFGIDAYYRPNWLPWFGVYGMAELMAARMLLAGETKNENPCTNCMQPADPPLDPSEPFTVTGVLIGFGVMGQF